MNSNLATFLVAYYVLLGISYIVPVIVGVVGWIRFKPEKMLRKVFPYIKKSGNHTVIFDFIIEKKYIKYHYMFLIYIIQSTLFIFCYNAFLNFSFKYNPYDDLECFARYNGSEITIQSEEQAKMDNVTGLWCFGWKFEIGGATGRAAAILTLSWIFVSIVLWAKLNCHYKANNCIKEGKKVPGYCGLVALFLFKWFFLLCNVAAYLLAFVFVFIYSIPELSISDILDFGLISIVLVSGLAVEGKKKAKMLANCCREVVENKQKGQEEDFETITDSGSMVDHLVEQAEIECKKVLADMKEDEKEREWDTVNEDEMRKIVQAAYRKVAPNDEREQSNEPTSTDEIQLEVRNGNNGSERGRIDDQGATEEPNTATERDGLLGNARRNKTSCQLM